MIGKVPVEANLIISPLEHSGRLAALTGDNKVACHPREEVMQSLQLYENEDIKNI